MPNLNFLLLNSLSAVQSFRSFGLLVLSLFRLVTLVALSSPHLFVMSAFIGSAADLTSASAALNNACRNAFGPDVVNTLCKETFFTCGAIVGELINTHGMASPEFKDASAKYEAIVPIWLSYLTAKNAFDAELAKVVG